MMISSEIRMLRAIARQAIVHRDEDMLARVEKALRKYSRRLLDDCEIEAFFIHCAVIERRVS